MRQPSRLCLSLIGLLISQQGVRSQELTFSELPTEIQQYVTEVRSTCMEQNPELRVRDPAQGVSVVRLTKEGLTDLMVDNEAICGTHMAGANCTNRACPLLIWQRRGGGWKRVFEESLYAKFISIDEKTLHLQMMAVSIYAGHRRCDPNPNADYSSGQSCDRLVVFKNGGWQWLAPWKDR